MDAWLQIPWAEILFPKQPVEMIARGVLTYFGLLVILRVLLRRQSGNLALSDLLVTVLIADAIQNGMAGEYRSVPDGLLLVTTIVAMDYLVDWSAYHVPFVKRLLTAAPVVLVKDGRLQRRNLRRELITDDELWTKLRQEGIEDLKEIKKVYLEDEGEISVIKLKK